MIYIFGWATIYYSIIITMVSKYRGQFFALQALFVLSLIAFFRAEVGTDTPNYEHMFLGFIENYIWNGQEPGFIALGMLLVKLSPSIEIAVRAVSLVIFFLFTVYLLRSDRNERNLFFLYLLPVFAYSYSMNALRAGIAFVFILMAIQFLKQGSKGTGFILGIISLTFHYSALLPLVYLFLAYRKRLSIYFLIWAGVLAFITCVTLIIGKSYFLDKFLAYSMFDSPSQMSGLSILLPSIILLVGVALSTLPSADKWKLIVLAGVSFTLAVILTQYSYAGLRILDLLSYAFPLSVLLSYSLNKMQFDKYFLIALFVAGTVSISASYYRYMNEYGLGLAPWLPYITWFSFE